MQALQFGKGEIFGEPALHRLTIDDLAGPPVCKFGMISDVGGAADLVFVPRDKVPVTGRD